MLTQEEENRRDAEACLEIADTALAARNYSKAERLLIKAERLYPTELAKRKLAEVLTAKHQSVPRDSSGSYKASTDDSEISAANAIDKARDAMSQHRYDQARRLLNKSLKIHNNNSIKELLNEVDELEKIFRSLSNPSTCKSSTEDSEMSAAKAIDKAKEAMTQSRYDKARRLLNKSLKMHSNNFIKELLDEIDELEKSSPSDNGDPSISSTVDSEMSAAQAIEKAREAMVTGKYEKARRLLNKSLKLHNNDSIKRLLDEVDESERISENPELSEEEALKCTVVAERAFKEGRLNKAIKLLQKAERFYSTIRAKDLLRQIESAKANGQKDIEPTLPKEPTRTNEKQAEQPRGTLVTPEHIEEIRRVTAAKNDYDIMGVEENSPWSVVNAQYKRLTLLLHPDKNIAPGAREAFMLVNEAKKRLKNNRDKCPVCFETTRRDEQLTSLPCSHTFHTACIGPWLQEQRTCPVCRKRVK